jgi:hypothetical protein
LLPSEYVQRLIEASLKKYALIQELLVLTNKQAEKITEDSVSEFESLVDKKQVKMNEVDKLDEEFNVYFQRLKQTLKISSLDELTGADIKGIKELKEAVSNIMLVLNEINTIELQNNIKAKKLLNQFGAEIKKINQGKKANSIYNPVPIGKPPSYFIDKKK